MRKKVTDYLKKPTDSLFAELTSEDQRYVGRLKKEEKKKTFNGK